MQAPLGNPQHMYGHSTWEPGLAVAAKPLLMRPLHDVLALAEVLDVVKPAAQNPSTGMSCCCADNLVKSLWRARGTEPVSVGVRHINDAMAAPDQAATQRRAASLVLL